MKLKKAMMSLVAATAAGLCISAYAANSEKGQSGTLNLTDPVTNASVVASGDTMTVVGGSWNEAPTVEEGWMVIDCDAATSNEFTAAVTTGAVVQCDFDLQVAPVPLSLRPASAADAQTAFCVCTNTTDGGAMFFCAWVNSVWVELDGFTVPAVDTEYMLRVTFDYKNGKYVKFSVKLPASENYTDLYDAAGSDSDKWFATNSSATGVRQYCFVGTGNVKSFTTAQADVEAETTVVPIPDPQGGDPTNVSIDIPEEAVTAFGDGDAATAAAALVEEGANGSIMLDNYILFGATSKDDVTKDTKPVAKPAIVADGDHNIPLGFTNLALKEVGGATVKYQLKGAETSAGPFSNVGEAETDAANLKIPANTDYRVFKVDVTVEYGN